jgi:threonine aldolase
VPNQPDGKLAIHDIEAAIRTDDIHFPRTRLLLLENTHNRCNGSPLDVDYLHSVREIAVSHGLKVHVDGARIFNAAITLGTKARDLAADADSVCICLSKGLAAPVGSVVCGAEDFIARARRVRKVLGGGMRQAGVLAAAGIVALTEMVDRLKDDHINARRLAEGLAGMDGLSLDPDCVKTNIVFFEITRIDMQSQVLAEKLNSQGIRLLPAGPSRLRAVTNYHVTSDDIKYVLDVFYKVLK